MSSPARGGRGRYGPGERAEGQHPERAGSRQRGGAAEQQTVARIVDLMLMHTGDRPEPVVKA
jgi:hypothetical protein